MNDLFEFFYKDQNGGKNLKKVVAFYDFTKYFVCKHFYVSINCSRDK